MMRIPLSGKKAAGRVVLIDDEDYELVSQYRWHIKEQRRPGRRVGPYAEVTVHHPKGTIPEYSCILMHCLILGLKGVDHRNGNGLDNQRANLRPGPPPQNGANRGKQDGVTTSRFKGVSWSRRPPKWRAAIMVNGRTQVLGYFAAEEDAARAYDTAALKAWGEYARPNFPETT